MNKEFIESIEGYQDMVLENEIARKAGTDYIFEKGSVQQFINRLHPPKLQLKVINKIDETEEAATIRLASTGDPLPPFQAGQYIALMVEVDGVKTARPYSISSSPCQTGYYDLTVQRVEGGLVSNYLLDAVQPGDLLESSGPAGQFVHNPVFHKPTMVCIGGGSGVTPFMSMIRKAADTGSDQKICLFYGSQSLSRALFHEELSDIAERMDNIVYVPVLENSPYGYSGKTGLITGDLLESVLEDFGDKTYYLCGPQGLYDFVTAELAARKVPARLIRREVYGPPADVSKSPGWPEDVALDAEFNVSIKNGPTFTAPAGRTLMTAFEQNGLKVPSICRSGECSMCRVKVLSGKVFQPAGALVRQADRRDGYIHSCVSYPLEDLEILI